MYCSELKRVGPFHPIFGISFLINIENPEVNKKNKNMTSYLRLLTR